ncbi:hypothetical protein CO154_00095 [Candidatus Pacearchaeota archaeon CG_4_9_14_3_um_filter_31_7]|nr:MAG: hypothetical protein AUJ10_00490 [Candidatus Pacearchaeota archaeon CG1_02_31_27]PIN92297.1 MAG: hypothetical protein COU55_00595 [Candidatus Pacearchaeota archaeon CG10_big_fil_rev_8_21_14_0_10_31_59]PIZ81146.1 MAG: hypothetical protein COX99_00555 [Candidatus Pacearchaeota archaeon CG_4_10_14_0_2_um_filter_31_10]PJA70976.1 MAG: hypothetical protein CO154_00095 [Candidatus Pacearchaeota archaeon CG_4_9_14_3_um_filter_31_7]
MVDKKFPEEEEAVLCTIKNIIGTSVFCNIDSYNLEGVINFSEVAPGRIRNIRDYVIPNKKIVCLVLRINKDSGHIDLSLRRVNSKTKKRVLEESQRENNAIAILKILVKDELKLNQIVEEIRGDYKFLSIFLQKLIEDKKIGSKYNFSNEELKNLIRLVKERIKIKKYKLKLKVSLKSNDSDGINRIVNSIKETKKKYDILVVYESAPKYFLVKETKDVKKGSKELREAAEFLMEVLKKNNGRGEIIGEVES